MYRSWHGKAENAIELFKKTILNGLSIPETYQCENTSGIAHYSTLLHMISGLIATQRDKQTFIYKIILLFSTEICH